MHSDGSSGHPMVATGLWTLTQAITYYSLYHWRTPTDHLGAVVEYIYYYYYYMYNY